MSKFLLSFPNELILSKVVSSHQYHVICISKNF
jgi:hypothetical protein